MPADCEAERHARSERLPVLAGYLFVPRAAPRDNSMNSEDLSGEGVDRFLARAYC